MRLLLSDGDREDYLDGNFIRRGGADWPLPGTHWQQLFLSPAKSGSASSLNDGSLTLKPAARDQRQSYPAAPTLPTNTDPPNTAIIGAAGVNQLSGAFPLLTEMTLTEPIGLSYATPPLPRGRDRGRPGDARRAALQHRRRDRDLGRAQRRLAGRDRAPADRRPAQQRLPAVNASAR